MSKYRDKSDFEINKAVAGYYLTRAYRFNSADEIVELIDIDLSCEFGGEINRVDTQVVGTFAPCNNPADAMPIIFDNNISLIFSHREYPLATNNPSGLFRDVLPPENVVTNKNPLRAAMELFLMMKEAENEKS